MQMSTHLWVAALTVWFLLIYFGFAVLAFRNQGQGEDIFHGGWLLAIVGTESLVILGALVAPLAGDLRPAVFILIHMLWGLGAGLYAILVTLLAYRIFFFAASPEDLTPVLWVIMGAAAISTNAGSTLLLADSGVPTLAFVRPLIEGMTLILWAWGSWWIPLLTLFGIWKHGVRRLPLVYTPALWSVIFPLGMYSVASFKLSLAADFPPLQTVASAMMWVSVAAWSATFIGLVVSCVRSFRNFNGP